MDDTSPEMMQKMREMCAEKTPEERFKMGCSMYETSKYLVTRFILENHPDISPLDFKKEFFLKFYANDFSVSEREKIFAHFDSLEEASNIEGN